MGRGRGDVHGVNRPWARASLEAYPAAGLIQYRTDALAGGGSAWGKLPGMPAAAFIPTELEWRTLAHACTVVAARERERAAGASGAAAAKEFESSAREFERLAAACMRMIRPAPL